MMVGVVGSCRAPKPVVRVVDRDTGGPLHPQVDEREPAHRPNHLPRHRHTLLPYSTDIIRTGTFIGYRIPTSTLS